MTTTVSVAAHCSDEIEVHVDICENEHAVAHTTVLQNGQGAEFYAYDTRTITVSEVRKK